MNLPSELWTIIGVLLGGTIAFGSQAYGIHHQHKIDDNRQRDERFLAGITTILSLASEAERVFKRFTTRVIELLSHNPEIEVSGETPTQILDDVPISEIKVAVSIYAADCVPAFDEMLDKHSEIIEIGLKALTIAAIEKRTATDEERAEAVKVISGYFASLTKFRNSVINHKRMQTLI